MTELDKELRTRNVAFELTLKVRPFEEGRGSWTRRASWRRVDRPRIPIPRIEAPSKTSAPLTEKEETANGEYEVDLSRYFKLLSADVDETIFEEE